MWTVNPNLPLPISDLFMVGDGVHFDSREAAIEALEALQYQKCYYLRAWVAPSVYGTLPGHTSVFWRDGKLLDVDSKKPLNLDFIFNTELEAIDFSIGNPDPTLLERRKEILNEEMVLKR